jgi:phosphoribosylanthranilate isomerase
MIMSTTAIKICGLTREADALAAARLGAHALGFVFYSRSPRNVKPAQAASIVQRLPPFVTTVGLFVNADAEEVHGLLRTVPIDLLQFHGDEPPEYCAQFGRPYIKALRVRAGVDLLQYAQRYEGARGLLLDAFVEGTPGGTGSSFDWSLIPASLPLPVVLSGGLSAANVVAAIQRVRPCAVDVSSGVEAAPGIKDAQKMQEFFQGVRNADG